MIKIGDMVMTPCGSGKVVDYHEKKTAKKHGKWIRVRSLTESNPFHKWFSLDECSK